MNADTVDMNITPKTDKPSPVVATVILERTKDCKGSVRFDNKDTMAALSSLYLSRVVSFAGTARRIKVTIEEVL